MKNGRQLEKKNGLHDGVLAFQHGVCYACYCVCYMCLYECCASDCVLTNLSAYRELKEISLYLSYNLYNHTSAQIDPTKYPQGYLSYIKLPQKP